MLGLARIEGEGSENKSKEIRKRVGNVSCVLFRYQVFIKAEWGHCAASRKVAGSSFDEVNERFQFT
jgi:hypothetical protein